MDFGKILSFLSPAYGAITGQGIGKILPFLSPAYGMASGKGPFGDLLMALLGSGGHAAGGGAPSGGGGGGSGMAMKDIMDHIFYPNMPISGSSTNAPNFLAEQQYIPQVGNFTAPGGGAQGPNDQYLMNS